MASQISQHVLDILEWKEIISLLKSRCSTDPGRNTVENLSPMTPPAIITQMKKISIIKELHLRGDSMDFSGTMDISSSLSRAEKGSTLSLDELADIRKFIMASMRIEKFLGSHREEFRLLDEEYDKLDRLEEISGLIVSSLTDEGDLSSRKYPIIKKMKEKIFSLRADCEKSLAKLVNSPHLAPALQEKIITSYNDRYVIMVKTSMRGKIKGAVHSISASGATAYIEPDQVRGLNNKIIILGLELQNEINIILAHLSEKTGESSAEIKGNLAAVSYLDFLTSGARLSVDIIGSEPLISSGPDIRLYGARHPLLHLIKKGEVVENDIELGMGYNCLVISGANTGGKTVILKTIGLIAIMAIYGLHIPARGESSIGIFGRIFADIGDDQNLAMSLSTFSGQIMVINDIIQNADSGSLVLIDEIIVGTNPAQGAALAQSIIEKLAERGCRIVVTTHYSVLKELASLDPKYKNGSVSFDLDTLKPTYRLSIGYPGVSFALEIARNCGIPEEIISRSTELINENERSTESLLEDIQRHRQELEEDRRLISMLKEELLRERERYGDKEKKLARISEELKMEKGIAFLDELKVYRKSISEKIAVLQEAGLKKLGEIQREVIDAQKEVSAKLSSLGRDNSADELTMLNEDEAAPGVKVFAAPLEIMGEIADIDSSGKSALINFGGSFRARFRISDLYLRRPIKGTEEKQKKKNKKSMPEEVKDGGIGPVIQTRYNTIDLRGKQVIEAINFMENSFDRLMRERINTVVVIHGHGTGALKEAVRGNLGHSFYAENFRPGDYGEGFDGVTIVKLKG